MTHAASGTPRILVIEDDAATRDVLQLVLDLDGYGVVFAVTGAAGLTALTTQVVDLLVLDRRLPDGDGLGISRRVRDEISATLPILLLTADHDRALDATARAAGVTLLLRKPFAPDELLAQVATLLRRDGAPPSAPPHPT